MVVKLPNPTWAVIWQHAQPAGTGATHTGAHSPNHAIDPILRICRMIRVTRTIQSPKKTTTTLSELMNELGPLVAGERAAFAHRCHERSISMAHVFLMTMLDKHGPLPMTRVAELLGSGLPTATGLVGRMEERGLVRRDHDTKDRRVVFVNLTDAGAAEVRELHEARQRRMAAAIGQLSSSEQAGLLTAIRSLRSALESVSDGNEGDQQR
jgi:DNA-binding MarR family transcriptional regulator